MTAVSKRIYLPWSKRKKVPVVKKTFFSKGVFIYDYAKDVFICPAGQILKKRKYRKKRKHYEYAASKKTCNSCALKEKCTRSKTGRTLKRHLRQDDIDLTLTESISAESKKDIKTRQHLMERSFARAKRYGYKRARWRRLWRVQIQEYLTAGIQNMMVLLGNIKEPAAAGAKIQTKHRYQKASGGFQEQFCYFKQQIAEGVNLLFGFKGATITI